MSDVREIGTHAHFPEQDRPIENVIARCASAHAPFAIEIGAGVIGAHLLRVTIIAAVGGVDLTTTLGHSRSRRGISIRPVFLHLRIEVTDLQIRDENQTSPRKGERAENSEEKRKQPFHGCTSSGSIGLRNVGTVAVRPSPKSIRTK